MVFLFLNVVLCSELSYDEKRVSLIRRIDFAWALETDEERERKKKQKKKNSKDATATWQWQSMVENLQLAHQELSVIIDLINTVNSVAIGGLLRFSFVVAFVAYSCKFSKVELHLTEKE